jgi:hypothetical protein
MLIAGTLSSVFILFSTNISRLLFAVNDIKLDFVRGRYQSYFHQHARSSIIIFLLQRSLT